MVLDVIIRPACEKGGDEGPLVAMLLVCFEHGLLVFLAPGLLVYHRVEVVVPSSSVGNYLSRHCLPVRMSMPYFDDIF